MQELPKTITRRYWYGTVIYHKLSEEKSKQFFAAVAGDNYTKPVNLYYGDDKKYYCVFASDKIYSRNGDSLFIYPTGISRSMIYIPETKEYKQFNERMLRDALYNMCCVYYDDEVLQDDKLITRYQKLFPLTRMKHQMMVNGGPIPKIEEEKWLHESDKPIYTSSLFEQPKLLKNIISEDETKSIMHAVYGRANDKVIFLQDINTEELFVYQDLRSKNYYDRLQIKYDFDYDSIEKYYHVSEKFDKPATDDDLWKIIDYFDGAENNFIKARRSCIIKMGVRLNMLQKSTDSNASNKYMPLSFDELKKVYMNIIYKLWQLW